jgi:hypothetical protein
MDPSWEGLFADLEAQFDAQERLELDAEVADRTRRERALVDLHSRLVGHLGRRLGVRVVTGSQLDGDLEDVGDGWVLLRGAVIPVDAVVAWTNLSLRPHDATRARRFGLGHVLRGLARDRAVVRVVDRSGHTATGTIDRVGADHLDLAEHAPDEPRRSAVVRGVRSIPFAALVSVHR